VSKQWNVAALSQPIRHHYIPQMIIRNFTDERGWVHGWDLDRPARGVFRSRPEGVFFEKHLYSIFDKRGVLVPEAETDLSRLEGQVSAIIQKLIRAARSHTLPGLTPDERVWWDLFFFIQWKRVPDQQRLSMTDAALVEQFDATTARLLLEHPERRTEIEALAQPEKRAQMLKNVRVGALLHPGRLVPEALASRGLSLLTIPDTKRSFLLGSRPVVKMAIRGAPDLTDERSEVWLPIAPDVAVGPGRKDQWEQGFTLTEAKPIRELNEATWSQSSMVIGRSPALVRSLASRR